MECKFSNFYSRQNLPYFQLPQQVKSSISVPSVNTPKNHQNGSYPGLISALYKNNLRRNMFKWMEKNSTGEWWKRIVNCLFSAFTSSYTFYLNKFSKGVRLANITNCRVTNCICLYLLMIGKLMLLRSMAAPATKGDIKTIFKKLNKISQSLVDNSSSLAQLTGEIRELKKSQQFLSEQYEDMKEKLHWKDNEVKDMQAENRSTVAWKNMSRSLRCGFAKLKRKSMNLNNMAVVSA